MVLLISMENTEQQLSKKERKELRRQENAHEREKQRKSKKAKQLLIFAILIVIIGASVWYLGKTNKKYVQESTTVNTVNAADHTKGNTEAKNVFIEYSDFQCPACKGYEPTLQKLFSDTKENMLFVYRHFPLRSVHPNAQLAAQAAEAANLQGKFWEMHDLLFERQDEWAEKSNPRDIFVGYAKNLGLNEQQFQKDIDSSSVKEKIDADYNDAIRLNLQGTPTFYLNGKQPEQASTYDDFIAKIKSAMQ